MERLRESDIIVDRFWKSILAIAPKNKDAVEVTYRHALFLMFLSTDLVSKELSPSIARNIWTRDDPGGSNARTDESLRRESIFTWLASSINHDYLNRLNRAYPATLDVLDREGERGIDLRFTEEYIPQQAKIITAWLDLHGTNDLLLAFDYGHVALLRPAFDVSREQFAAELAAALLIKGRKKIGDFFSATAKFSKLMQTQHNANLHCVLTRKTQYDEIINMRLRMMQSSFRYLKIADLNSNGRTPQDFPLDFLLINPIRHYGMQSAPTEMVNDDEDSFSSAIELIWKLCRREPYFSLALVVVPHSDCVSKTQGALKIRQELVGSGRIIAVVDFPKTASDNRRRFSAWLVNGNPSGERNGSDDYADNGDKILFIDAEPLSLLTPTNESNSTAQFIATLLADLFEDVESQFQLLDGLETTEPLLARILAREFAPGSHEAPGLARSVTLEQVRQHHFSLSASTYLKSDPISTWLHGTDKSQITELLNTDDNTGKRIYVIGNNGEGKSLLLRDIATESAKNGRHTVAIAFGSTDRFARAMAGGAKQYYSYKGARTASRGINAVQTAVDIGKLMLEIHSDREKLTVFEEVVNLIGFAPQQFLIPKNLTANTPTEGVISGIVRLTFPDSDDQYLLNRLKSTPEFGKKYKLGLRRASSKDDIVPFDELSSGEQQILQLTTKVLSEAASGVLILVDEPEISLHVSWQKALPKILGIIANRFRTNIIVATHSPVVIASTDLVDDHCFTIRARSLNALFSRDRRSVETTLFEGFRTYTNNNREVHEKCASLVADFIEAANLPTNAADPQARIMNKLQDMRKIIEYQMEFNDDEKVKFDIKLIELAQAAIKEIGIPKPVEKSRQDR